MEEVSRRTRLCKIFRQIRVRRMMVLKCCLQKYNTRGVAPALKISTFVLGEKKNSLFAEAYRILCTLIENLPARGFFSPSSRVKGRVTIFC